MRVDDYWIVPGKKLMIDFNKQEALKLQRYMFNKSVKMR